MLIVSPFDTWWILLVACEVFCLFIGSFSLEPDIIWFSSVIRFSSINLSMEMLCLCAISESVSPGLIIISCAETDPPRMEITEVMIRVERRTLLVESIRTDLRPIQNFCHPFNNNRHAKF